MTVADVTVSCVLAPEHVARVLDLEDNEEDSQVCVRSRTYLVDDRPVNFAVSYFPLSLVKGSRIVEVDTGEGGVYARLAEMGAQPASFREEVRSRMPSEGEAERLSLQAGSPVLAVARTAFTVEGRAVELNEMILDGSAYVLDYAFDA